MRPSAPWPRPVGAVMLAAACVLAAERVRSADPPRPDGKAKPVEANKVELHLLKNDDVLNQAAGIYDQAAQDYLAAARALATAEILLEEAAKQTDAPAWTETEGPRPPDLAKKEPT